MVVASPLSAQELKLRETLKGHTDWAWSVVFSPDGKTLASGGGKGASGEIKLWDVATGKNTVTLNNGHGSVFSVSYSPDGTMLASGGGDKGHGGIRRQLGEAAAVAARGHVWPCLEFTQC